jgi:hypothetical protein
MATNKAMQKALKESDTKLKECERELNYLKRKLRAYEEADKISLPVIHGSPESMTKEQARKKRKRESMAARRARMSESEKGKERDQARTRTRLKREKEKRENPPSRKQRNPVNSFLDTESNLKKLARIRYGKEQVIKFKELFRDDISSQVIARILHHIVPENGCQGIFIQVRSKNLPVRFVPTINCSHCATLILLLWTPCWLVEYEEFVRCKCSNIARHTQEPRDYLVFEHRGSSA